VAFGEEQHRAYVERGVAGVDPSVALAVFAGAAPGNIAIELGLRGPSLANSNSCASGAVAIGEAFRLVRDGHAPVMLAGGAEAPLAPLSFGAFALNKAMSIANDCPARASRPFDAGRDGFVMGEAGAVLVLEELEHAKARGAHVRAEVLGYGTSSDAQHVTEPDPTGGSPARAMRMAMADAGIGPDDVDYVNAHGTSTPVGDVSETRVLKLALGEEAARRTPVSSTKGATGHCLGASGALEAIFCVLAINEGIVPPTINYETPDPGCDLDYVPNKARPADVRVAVSNSFGFGGHNASLVLGRFDG
jgi:3-oxoacyl-[acyl-carrier-protein] synthase II